MKLDDLLNKTCLIGISYFNASDRLLKQLQLAGTVIATDPEQGITVSLHPKADTSGNTPDEIIASDSTSNDPARFMLPASLKGWFKAPPGLYRDADRQVLINNPDFLVTWDVYQTRDATPEGEHEWWEWRPRTVPPSVG